MNPLNRVMPKEIFQQGRNLISLGIDEYAWDRKGLEDVMKILFDHKIGILGGDVYRESDGNIEITCDSWYLDDDGTDSFYLESHQHTLDYINEYEKNNCGSYLYSIVPKIGTANRIDLNG